MSHKLPPELPAGSMRGGVPGHAAESSDNLEAVIVAINDFKVYL